MFSKRSSLSINTDVIPKETCPACMRWILLFDYLKKDFIIFSSIVLSKRHSKKSDSVSIAHMILFKFHYRSAVALNFIICTIEYACLTLTTHRAYNPLLIFCLLDSRPLVLSTSGTDGFLRHLPPRPGSYRVPPCTLWARPFYAPRRVLCAVLDGLELLWVQICLRVVHS